MTFHEVRSVFLGMSKAFGKVWQSGIIFKLKQNSISGNYLSTLTDILKFRRKKDITHFTELLKNNYIK